VISSVLFFFNLRLESINFACPFQHGGPQKYGAAKTMTEQNRRYVNKEIGKLLSEIWRIKGPACTVKCRNYCGNNP
jgi:hypothetical protein